MTNKEAKLILIRDYGKICMLGGVINKRNIITIHHLKPLCCGGRAILVNLALLGRLEHDMFNEIERENKRKAKEINDYLRYYKKARDELARMQMNEYINNEIKDMGLEIKKKGKRLVLRRS